MPDKKNQSTAQKENIQDVDRIRDIIFGAQIRDFENRFEIMQRDLERLQQELNHLGDQTTEQDNNHSKKLQDLRREMRDADNNVRDELRQSAQKLTTDKVDRTSLGELFIELGNHLKTGGALSELLQGLGEQIE